MHFSNLDYITHDLLVLNEALTKELKEKPNTPSQLILVNSSSMCAPRELFLFLKNQSIPVEFDDNRVFKFETSEGIDLLTIKIRSLFSTILSEPLNEKSLTQSSSEFASDSSQIAQLNISNDLPLKQESLEGSSLFESKLLVTEQEALQDLFNYITDHSEKIEKNENGICIQDVPQESVGRIKYILEKRDIQFTSYEIQEQTGWNEYSTKKGYNCNKSKEYLMNVIRNILLSADTQFTTKSMESPALFGSKLLVTERKALQDLFNYITDHSEKIKKNENGICIQDLPQESVGRIKYILEKRDIQFTSYEIQEQTGWNEYSTKKGYNCNKSKEYLMNVIRNILLT